MAAKKKKPATKKPTRRPPRRRRTPKQASLKNTAAFILGGAGGALAAGFLVRSGVKPTTAAVGVGVAGTVAAMTMAGAPRLAAGAVAAAGAGQLALVWLAKQNTESANKNIVINTKKKPKDGRNAAHLDDIDAAFDRAREQLALEDESAEFSDFDDDDDREVAA